ncbi:adhesin [Methanobrevibacter sp.]|uniref:adhesin n=1 Tax=Methanobrevibacter sp. TaxID=66852 RepID=UPI00386CF0DA
MKKFTIIDYIIIILVICAVVFAFIHITTDNTSNLEKTAFDTSTISKIPVTYSNYYQNGNIVKASVEGYNASTGEDMTVNGTVKWVCEDISGSVKVLIYANNTTYLAGLYKDIPNADIYINTLSLESDGSKYDNLVEFTILPEKVTSLNDLCKNLTDVDCEISTIVTFDTLNPTKLQEIANKINSKDKRLSIMALDSSSYNQLRIEKATVQNINDANSILGNVNGITDEITIRVYNCSDSQLENIKNNYNVTNIRNF